MRDDNASMKTKEFHSSSLTFRDGKFSKIHPTKNKLIKAGVKKEMPIKNHKLTFFDVES